MQSDTRLSRFQRATLKNWEWPGDKARLRPLLGFRHWRRAPWGQWACGHSHHTRTGTPWSSSSSGRPNLTTYSSGHSRLWNRYTGEYRTTTRCVALILWHVKAWRARVRKYTEIIEDYGGVANGCQLSLLAEEWSVGQRTSR